MVKKALVLFLAVIFLDSALAESQPPSKEPWDDKIAIQEINAEIKGLQQETKASGVSGSEAQVQARLEAVVAKIQKVMEWEQIKNEQLPKVSAALDLLDALWAQELNAALLSGVTKKPLTTTFRIETYEDKINKAVKEAKEWIEKIPSLKTYAHSKEVEEFRVNALESMELKNAMLKFPESEAPLHECFKKRADLLYLKTVFQQWLQANPLE